MRKIIKKKQKLSKRKKLKGGKRTKKPKLKGGSLDNLDKLQSLNKKKLTDILDNWNVNITENKYTFYEQFSKYLYFSNKVCLTLNYKVDNDEAPTDQEIRNIKEKIKAITDTNIHSWLDTEFGSEGFEDKPIDDLFREAKLEDIKNTTEKYLDIISKNENICKTIGEIIIDICFINIIYKYFKATEGGNYTELYNIMRNTTIYISDDTNSN